MMEEPSTKKKLQRVCLTLDLVNDPNLISEYKKYHRPANTWEVIIEGIRNAGIEIMDIYNVDNRLFMICEFPSELSLVECWRKMADAPKQDEWAELMAKFQQALPGHKLEWVEMERIFTLNNTN
ncbi:L-rhamnose mutarotase [Carboxylicivirga sediminis]|uniref:L-rhamnose mutarotase n=2 Tax=Carboxylicivirga sediminis TaxID=2006564 RepID=A0A941IYK4_9BACT|nr:L-rhamnose mutarotase [Carboxylicivirga sediminis]